MQIYYINFNINKKITLINEDEIILFAMSYFNFFKLAP